MSLRLRPIAASVIAATLSATLAAGAHAEEEVEEIVVVGQRAMLYNALSNQKESDVIKSVINRDAIGQFPDQNVAEAVRRLSGINVLNDQGEGRFIAVRGLDPSLNAASVNGTRIPSPEADTRSVALDVIPSELIESIEVNKTLTPDMDADTIGAAIRINTVNALDRSDSFISAKIESSYNDLNEETSPRASVDFSYPFSEDFAVSGGVSFDQREFSTDNVESEGWAITDTGIYYADALEYRDYDVQRDRLGGSLSFDFRLGETTQLYARTLYSKFDDLELRRRLVFEMDEEPSSGDLNTATFLSDDGEISVRRGIKDRFETQTIQTWEFGGETLLDDWQFEYKASYAAAEEHEYKTQDPTRFRNDFDEAGQLAVTFDYSQLTLPTFAVTTGLADFNAASTYEFNKVELVDGRSEDEEVALQLDITRTLSNMELKFGGKYRARQKRNDIYLEVREDFDSYTLADVAGTQTYGLFDLGVLPDLGAVRAFNAANLDNFEVNQFDTDFESSVEDFRVDEDVAAAYVMAKTELGAWTMIGGLRWERTEQEVNGNLTEVVEEGGTRDGVVLPDDFIFVSPAGFTESYSNVLPSLSLRHDQGDVVFRVGTFKSLVRPNIAQLAPIFAVEEADDGEREGEFGNPDLEPYMAWNTDMSVEWYFAPASVLQAGLFHKSIDDFVFTGTYEAGDAPFNGVFNGIAFDEASIPLNGDSAEVSGFEFNYQHALTNLSAPLDGIILGLNYTLTDTEAGIGSRTIPLPAASKNNYNGMLGYEKGPLSLRLTVAYRDEYLDEVGGSAEEDRYVKDHTQWDLTASYRVTENFRVYGQFINMNDEPYVAFQRGPLGRDSLLQYEEYSWTARFGLQATF